MLILNIVVLCGILAGLAVVAGVAFGGIRILMKRWYPDKVFDRPEQMEFISLAADGNGGQGDLPRRARRGSSGAGKPRLRRSKLRPKLV